MSSQAWPEPWRAVEDGDEQQSLTAQLRRELGPQHPDAGLRAVALGRRVDDDDVLFALPDGQVAEVHLTWVTQPGPDPSCPPVTRFASFQAWREDWTAMWDELHRSPG